MNLFLLSSLFSSILEKDWALIALSLLALNGSGFAILRIRLKQLERRANEKMMLHKKIANMELKALRAQMNPHFIFNALNSIQNLITRNDQPSAKKYLSIFSKLMRSTLDNSRLPLIPLEEELSCLNLYLELESLRLGAQFGFTFQIDPAIDVKSSYIPAMLIQPFLENAIWHGLPHKEGEKKLELKMKKQHNNIVCEITDNGIGRKKAAELGSKLSGKHKSLSMEIIGERLELLNTLNDRFFEMKITDLTDKNGHALGTHVELIIPFELNF